MKRIISILTLCLSCLGVMAQEFNRSEVSINLGLGVSGFQTQPTRGSESQSWTTTLGAGYHLFFNPKWGIGTGLGIAVYNGGISIPDYGKNQLTYNQLTNDVLDFQVYVPNYRETQQAMMATIPLMLQYQSVGKTIFYGAVGAKAGIPLFAKARQKGIISTAGWYENLQVMYENMPDYGFVLEQPFPKEKADIDLNVAFMASAEVGIKRLLVNRMNLYLGLYFDYGLNDILKRQPDAGGSPNLVVYQPDTPAIFAYNTAVNSFAKQVKPFAVGFTARLTVAKRTWDKSYFKFREEGR